MQRMPRPKDILDGKRLVETIEGAHLRLHLGGGVGWQDCGQRIARRYVDQHEADDAHTDRDGNDVQKSFECVEQHGVLSK